MQCSARGDICTAVRGRSALHQHLVHIYASTHALCPSALRPPPCLSGLFTATYVSHQS